MLASVSFSVCRPQVATMIERWTSAIRAIVSMCLGRLVRRRYASAARRADDAIRRNPSVQRQQRRLEPREPRRRALAGAHAVAFGGRRLARPNAATGSGGELLHRVLPGAGGAPGRAG